MDTVNPTQARALERAEAMRKLLEVLAQELFAVCESLGRHGSATTIAHLLDDLHRVEKETREALREHSKGMFKPPDPPTRVRDLQQELGELYRRRAEVNNRLQAHRLPDFLAPLDDLTIDLLQALRPIDARIQETINALGELGSLVQSPFLKTQTAELTRALLEREWTNDGVEATCKCGAVRGLAWFPHEKGQSPYGDGFSGCATTQSPYLMHAPTCIFQWLPRPLGTGDDHPTHYEP
jgi:hypothetical protein